MTSDLPFFGTDFSPELFTMMHAPPFPEAATEEKLLVNGFCVINRTDSSVGKETELLHRIVTAAKEAEAKNGFVFNRYLIAEDMGGSTFGIRGDKTLVADLKAVPADADMDQIRAVMEHEIGHIVGGDLEYPAISAAARDIRSFNSTGPAHLHRNFKQEYVDALVSSREDVDAGLRRTQADLLRHREKLTKIYQACLDEPLLRHGIGELGQYDSHSPTRYVNQDFSALRSSLAYDMENGDGVRIRLNSALQGIDWQPNRPDHLPETTSRTWNLKPRELAEDAQHPLHDRNTIEQTLFEIRDADLSCQWLTHRLQPLFGAITQAGELRSDRFSARAEGMTFGLPRYLDALDDEYQTMQFEDRKGSHPANPARWQEAVNTAADGLREEWAASGAFPDEVEGHAKRHTLAVAKAAGFTGTRVQPTETASRRHAREDHLAAANRKGGVGRG